MTHRFRWMSQVPLRDGKDAMLMNWFEIEIGNAAGEVTYRNSFITDLPVGRDNVAELATCGRARWKVSVAPPPHCVACRYCDPVRQDAGQPINLVMCIGAALGA